MPAERESQDRGQEQRGVEPSVSIPQHSVRASDTRFDYNYGDRARIITDLPSSTYGPWAPNRWQRSLGKMHVGLGEDGEIVVNNRAGIEASVSIPQHSDRAAIVTTSTISTETDTAREILIFHAN